MRKKIYYLQDLRRYLPFSSFNSHRYYGVASIVNHP